MTRRRRPGCESLEVRQMPSAGPLISHFIASSVDGDEAGPQQSAPPSVAAPLAGAAATIRGFLASADSMSSRWNWLAGTEWYVPVENLLAYSASQDLSDPQPIGDQTIWNIETSGGGHITGTAITKLTSIPIPTQKFFVGTVTADGQIRIEFSSENGNPLISGLGQMRYDSGKWYMQMQMETGLNPLITHWAYMAQGEDDQTPPDSSQFSPDINSRSYEWRWLEGTHWAIRDTQLFGPSQTGVFEIEGFHNGYYWGTGTSAQPFNVLGSVTPQGNLLLLVSVNGADPGARAGQLFGNASGARMTFHSYQGDPAVGSAWMLNNPQAHGIRGLLASAAVQ